MKPQRGRGGGRAVTEAGQHLQSEGRNGARVQSKKVRRQRSNRKAVGMRSRRECGIQR
jgi:hypothetical protein